ncbi:hypothetical protein ACQP2X_05660 [Actinoplanes sp. CA-131856]
MSAVRALWLALSLLASAIAGVAGGALAHAGGEHAAKSVIAGAATFAGAETLCLLILSFLAAGMDRPTANPRSRR